MTNWRPETLTPSANTRTLRPVTRRARSAITGRFVTLWYALTHPKTTIIELVENLRKKA